MKVVPLAITKPDWRTLAKFGQEWVRHNPLDGLAESIIDQGSPAAFPACLDFLNDPLRNLAKGHTENSTFHHCYITFGIILEGKLRTMRGVEILELENDCLLATGSIETWYELIVKKLTTHGTCWDRRLLCHILLHLERIGFREMFAKFEKIQAGGDLYYIKEV